MVGSRDRIRNNVRLGGAARGARRTLLVALAALGASLSAYCGGGSDSNGGNGASPCDSVYSGRCGVACAGDDAACGDGLYCSQGACTADCTPSGGCADGQTCSPRGRCVGGGAGPGQGGSGGGGFTPGGGNGSGGGGGPGSCAKVTVQFTPVLPLITLLIDKSGSMNCPIDDASNGCPGADENGPKARWRVLKDALIASEGIVKRLESQAYFGVTFYSGDDETCPPFLEAEGAALNNYDTVKKFYDGREFDDGASTPTGLSLELTVNATLASPAAPADTPRYVILCTDGLPDLCNDGGDEVNGKLESIAAAKYGFERGVKTFVIAIGGGVNNAAGREHFQELADAGVGFKAPNGSTKAGKFFLATEQAALAEAFDEIIFGNRPCSFDLDADITPEAAAAAPAEAVTIDGRAQKYDDPDGWKLVDSDTIEFVGKACDDIRKGAQNVQASFACNTAGVTPKPR